MVNNLEEFSETFQLKIYEFENFNVISTHKIASSVVKSAYLKHGLDYYKIDLDLDFEIVNDFKNNSHKFKDILKSNKKIYILYRDPIRRCISAFFQSYQNDNNFSHWIGDEPTDTIFEEYKYLTEYFSEEDLIMYNKRVAANNHDMELFTHSNPNTIYLDIWSKILTDELLKKLNNGIIRLSNMNSPYLLCVYKLIKDFNINYSLINIDSTRFDLILQENLSDYNSEGYLNYKPKARSLLENIVENNKIISNVLRELHFDERFVYNELEKLSSKIQ